MARGDRRLVQALMEHLLEGTLLTEMLVEASGLDVEAINPEWEALMENIRAEEAPEDLQELAVTIDERVIQLLKPGGQEGSGATGR